MQHPPAPFADHTRKKTPYAKVIYGSADRIFFKFKNSKITDFFFHLCCLLTGKFIPDRPKYFGDNSLQGDFFLRGKDGQNIGDALFPYMPDDVMIKEIRASTSEQHGFKVKRTEIHRSRCWNLLERSRFVVCRCNIKRLVNIHVYDQVLFIFFILGRGISAPVPIQNSLKNFHIVRYVLSCFRLKLSIFSCDKRRMLYFV